MSCTPGLHTPSRHAQPSARDEDAPCGGSARPSPPHPPHPPPQLDSPRPTPRGAPVLSVGEPGASSSHAGANALLLDFPRPASPVTERGVSLAYLLQLAESGLIQEDWTVHRVVQDFVRHTTNPHGCCLFDLVPTAHIMPPAYFISHSWGCEIGNLLRQLKAHFKCSSSASTAAADVGLWMVRCTHVCPPPHPHPTDPVMNVPVQDIFAINQTVYSQKTTSLLEDDISNLEKVRHHAVCSR
jgi:hypothetical protein